MPGFLTLLLALPLSTALFIFSPTMAHAKNRPDPWTETHGGDPTVFEFEDLASQIYVDLSRLDEFKLIPKDFTKKFILNTFRRLNRVSSTSALLTVDGNTKTALNRVSPEDPQKKDIVIHTAAWMDLGADDRYRLVLHELLLVAGYDDLNYEISNLLFSYHHALEDVLQSYRTIFLGAEVDIHQYVQEHLTPTLDSFPTLKDDAHDRF